MLLKKDDKNNDKNSVKTVLTLLGITADGIFGPKTESAVKEFLKAKGLDIDGIVGPLTWAELQKMTNNSKLIDPSVVYAPLKSCISRLTNRTIKYIAIHYTAGGSSAPSRAINMKNSWEKTKRASADFGVDDRDMVQFNPDPKNYYCWAVGDTKQPGAMKDANNRNTISIEVCSNLKTGTDVHKPNHEGWYYTEAALNNAEKLVKILMKKFNVPVERVVRHYDISGKLCPGIVGWNDGVLYNTDGTKTNKKNNSSKWLAFKERLK